MRGSQWVGAAVLAFAVGVAGAAAAANKTIKVGDGTADGSFLQPYDNVWLYTVRRPDGRVVPQGLWSDHMQATTVGGVPAMLRVQGATLINGLNSSTVNVFDPKTMAPFWSEAHQRDGTVLRRDFKGAHVVAKRTSATGEAKVTETDLDQPVFDFNGGMYGMILAALPLKPGASGVFPTIEEFDDKPATDSYRVLRQEPVKAGSHGMVRAWVVESERAGQYKMTFWPTKRAPYIIRLVYEPAKPGALVYSWDMI